MQEAMIVDGRETLEKLNEILKQGGKIVQMCQMPSSCGISSALSEVQKINNRPTCLVIVEK